MNTFVEPLENIFRTNKREGHAELLEGSAEIPVVALERVLDS
jgi:hypothetical protein